MYDDEEDTAIIPLGLLHFSEACLIKHTLKKDPTPILSEKNSNLKVDWTKKCRKDNI